MKNAIALILDDCLAQMAKGATVEECLRMYPEHAGELRSLLLFAADIKKVPAPESPSNALAELMFKVGEQSVASKKAERVLSIPIKKRPFFTRLIGHRKLVWAVNVAFALLALTFGAATLSANSLPGDFLYPLKLATDKVVFMLTLNSDRKAELRITFSEKRLQELTARLQHSNTLDTGLVKAMLNEAALALEETDTASIEKPHILARLDNLNAYQKAVLDQIRPRVDSVSQRVVSEAIDMCDARGTWLRGMMYGDHDSISERNPTVQQKETPHTRAPRRPVSRRSENCEWGPGCNW